jgi:hypothetical protein
LRLPAELRNSIWEYAYGGGMVHVRFRTFKRQITSALLCHRCVHDIIPGSEGQGCCMRRDPPPMCIPVVCKQYWAEASTTFFASNSFSINDQQVFRALVLSNSDFVSRIKQLDLALVGFLYTHRPWAAAVNSSTVGYLKSLRGVTIAMCIATPDNDIELEQDDVLGSAYWKAIKLPEIVRAFQQHRLDQASTRFTLLSYRRWNRATELDPGKVAVFEGRVKDLLLEHHPRRISRRGQEGE